MNPRSTSKRVFSSSFDQKGLTFFGKKILNQSNRWEDVIKENGHYIID